MSRIGTPWFLKRGGGGTDKQDAETDADIEAGEAKPGTTAPGNASGDPESEGRPAAEAEAASARPPVPDETPEPGEHEQRSVSDRGGAEREVREQEVPEVPEVPEREVSESEAPGIGSPDRPAPDSEVNEDGGDRSVDPSEDMDTMSIHQAPKTETVLSGHDSVSFDEAGLGEELNEVRFDAEDEDVATDTEVEIDVSDDAVDQDVDGVQGGAAALAEQPDEPKPWSWEQDRRDPAAADAPPVAPAAAQAPVSPVASPVAAPVAVGPAAGDPSGYGGDRGSEDLWGVSFDVPKMETPKSVMLTQAGYLETHTGGLLAAVVETETVRSAGGGFSHTFSLIAPAIPEFSYRLMSVAQPPLIWPATVTSEALDRPTKCETLSDFLRALRDVLSASRTEQVIQALLAQAHEEE